jgi:hypothetical protein
MMILQMSGRILAKRTRKGTRNALFCAAFAEFDGRAANVLQRARGRGSLHGPGVLPW